MPGMETTRLAPSPTGALHLGNARTFLVNWALARQHGWRIVLRIEDLDGPRIKAGAAEQAIETLRWLGMDWDAGPVYQSHDMAPYDAALRRLADAGEIYPCACTRSQIAAAALSAPHAGDHEVRYPGTCRPEEPLPADYPQEGCAWRLRTHDIATCFDDAFAGHVESNVNREVGDFLVATKAGTPGYQLAVVVDDARQGITQVVRGDDLLTSTPRQLTLYKRLGLGKPPTYWHLPMVVGEDGRRLAKRHGDTRVNTYRKQGVPSARLIGLMADWCGIGKRREMSIEEFCDRVRVEQLPAEQVVFTGAENDWLLG